MILSQIQFDTSNHEDTQTFLVLLIQPVKIVFHSAKFSMPGDDFSCLLRPFPIDNWFHHQAKETSVSHGEFHLVENGLNFKNALSANFRSSCRNISITVEQDIECYFYFFAREFLNISAML